MTGAGTVERVFVAKEGGAPMERVPSVEAVAGRGLRGDRYFHGTGTFVDWTDEADRPPGYDVTLIELEALEAIEREADISLNPGEHRRNIETRDVALNHLVGKRFRVGDAVCRGDRLCEPCSYLENRVADGVQQALVHRGGLRADVLEPGTIWPGDAVEPLE